MNSAIFKLGFRPFFLLGSAYAVVAMALWIGPLFPSALNWHAHEMIYGFATAIVAGFLLTAVRNWTGVQTLHGGALAGLAGLWLAARLLSLIPETALWAATFDLLFVMCLVAAVAWPVYQVRQWRQWGILSCLAFLFLGQLFFVLGNLELRETGQRTGIQLGLFALLGLIFIIAGRVIPFFTERGVGCPVTLTQDPWLDRWLMPLYSLFAGLAVFMPETTLTRSLALIMAALHLVRLSGWYNPGIWRRPLLWVLHTAYLWLILGFVLYGAGKTSLAIHALAVGGLGGMILGMICRVSLGHTGRNIQQPPKVVILLFLLLFSAATVRTVFPWLIPGLSLLWYRLAGLGWITAFAGFLWWYAPMLWLPRVDGKPD